MGLHQTLEQEGILQKHPKAPALPHFWEAVPLLRRGPRGSRACLNFDVYSNFLEVAKYTNLHARGSSFEVPRACGFCVFRRLMQRMR
eukprot:symbB.v1.2.032163.t2/scaffold3822.1/size49698/3